MMMPLVEMFDVGKVILDRNSEQTWPIIQDISLAIPRGSVVALIGPNGCGKSTLLRLIAGLDTATTGRLAINALTTPLRVEFMFQDYRATFFPWFSVGDNLRCSFQQDDEEQRLAIANFERLLPEMNLRKFPANLSGGEFQAAALARSLARKADLLLLDEPFNSLDVAVHSKAVALCQEVVARGRVGTVVIVTHDLEDVATLAHKAVLLRSRPGRIECEIDLGDPVKRDSLDGFVTTMKALKSKLHESLSLQ